MGCRAHVADQLVEDAEVALLLVLPGEVLHDALASLAPHLGAPGRVVEERDHGLRVLLDVVGLHVVGRVGRGHPGLAQVERHDRKAEGHVLHRLVHRRDVVEGVERIGAQPEVGRGEHLAHEVVGDTTGQVDGVGETELVAAADQVVVAVAGPHERERDVVAPEPVDHDVGGAEREVDAVLRAHDAEVGHQVAATAAQIGYRLAPAQPLGVRPGAHDADVLGRLPAAGRGDGGVRLVGRGDPVGGPEGLALEEQQALVGGALAALEAGEVELRAQVVVVEHEPGAVQAAQPARDRPEDVGRVAGLHRVERAAAPGAGDQPRGREERPGVLDEVAQGAAPRGVPGVGEDPHAVDDLGPAGALALRADDRDVVPPRHERLALQPDPAVEGDREVLDDDRHPGSVPRGTRAGAHQLTPW